MAKKKTIKRPKRYKIEYYFWYEIRDYIEKKYGKNIRDWAGRWNPKHNPDAPYQDFWHTIINKFAIVNGNNETHYVRWDDYQMDYDIDPWEQEIITILVKEGFDEVNINFSW